MMISIANVYWTKPSYFQLLLIWSLFTIQYTWHYQLPINITRISSSTQPHCITLSFLHCSPRHSKPQLTFFSRKERIWYDLILWVMCYNPVMSVVAAIRGSAYNVPAGRVNFNKPHPVSCRCNSTLNNCPRDYQLPLASIASDIRSKNTTKQMDSENMCYLYMVGMEICFVFFLPSFISLFLRIYFRNEERGLRIVHWL